MPGIQRKLLVFIALAYLFAAAIDLATFAALRVNGATDPQPGSLAVQALATLAWGLLRMWSVTAAALLAEVVEGGAPASFLKRWLSVSKRSLACYFSAPLLVYLALAIYALVAAPLGLFDFNAYVELIASQLRASGLPEALAPTLAYQQLLLGYVAAVTINAAFALGEELGWRGYMFDILDRKLSLKSTALIGVAWGLWHAPATLLLGHNYRVNRLLGGFALFPILATLLTYPHLLLVKASGSVLPAASLHGAVNALWGLTVVASRQPVELREVYAGLGLAGFAAWAILDTLLVKLKAKLLAAFSAGSGADTIGCASISDRARGEPVR